ncbi:hypothetical protein PPSIR1_16425 [Plesiocystis pacifica SIR-1]|uniref:Uncharacterized protein n=1 Tax=Plesiocystis pacifica SIR-1 TaxID=391625 RepID=A6G340_9BACT|nr:SpvB/TcaC N-terminal domain-containing protein [Plesiocystis pacifica]EDM79665.1 hypothetical protein PPSIR1_16425 [Plesiocystis pacifica SIR-1]
MSDEKFKGPGQTSGPSLPIHGPQPREPFNAGVTPGRDAPGMGVQSKDDANPFTGQLRSPFGGGADSGQVAPTATFAPSISLPTGGGALRSIGEKFSPNPFTGGGSMAVPIATSPGRGGFGPSLSLSYSSGLGNGPFGLGWMLGVPAISRKTDKGLPEYRDDDPDLTRRDTFVLAGVEDLVHVLDEQGEPWVTVRDGHRVHRFCPRVEGGFSRIERWRSLSTGEVHWRTLSPGNVTSIFGKSASARISDPKEPSRVFSWLLEESHDDRGNIVVYRYKQDDLEGVDTHAPYERPRIEENPVQAQRYLERILYGNATPFQQGGWLFEAVLDYGEYGTDQPNDQLEVSTTPVRPWPARLDTFSTHRAGFELRTRRLCRRVLMFHHFAELGPGPTLVASTDFIHAEDPALTRIVGVVQRSYLRDEQTGFYDSAALPTLEFDYSEPVIDETLHEVRDPTTLRNLPAGLDGRQHRLVDLDGEGLPGIVTEHAGTWSFKRGLGDGRFGAPVVLPSRPTNLAAPGTQLMDLDGDGRKELVSFVAPTPGFFRRTADESWGSFQRFSSVPNIDWQSPNVQLLDLSGDGFPDILVDRGRDFVWYRSKGAEGFEAPRVVPNPRDDRSRPVTWFSDARTAIQLADMTGDGLVDLVRIRNGEVLYWANLGHGRFGPPVRMAGLSPFAPGKLFEPSRLRLADVDGSGATDIFYLDDRGASYYRNLAGNTFAAKQRLNRFPGLRSVDWAEVVDFKGTGTACLVWSSALPSGRGPQRGGLRYIDLMSGQKPHLLVASRNNMGAETRVAYAPSTKFYLVDKAAGRPWATKLPFPVHVVERVESLDHVSRQRHVQRSAYHHGVFDGQEREFRGFGMVETWDTESFEEFSQDGLFALEQFDNVVEEGLHQPPVHTKTWFHTGAYLGAEDLAAKFEAEYWAGDVQAPSLPKPSLPAGLTGQEAREATRAFAGMTLRSEVYALDGSLEASLPYTVSQATFEVRQLQHRGPNRYGVYQALPRESVALHYERVADDPRVAHSFVVETDAYGTPLRSAELVYPRRVPQYPEQGQLHATLSEASVVHLDGLDDALRLAVPVEARAYELTGLDLGGSLYTSWQAVRDAADTATELAFEATPTPGQLQKRLLTHSRTRYLADDLSSPLAQGVVESKALVHDSQALAMTEAQRQAVFSSLTGAPTNTELQTEGGYLLEGGNWWLRSGHPTYDASKFFAVTSVTDPFGHTYSTAYDAYSLLTTSSTDPLGNTVTAEHDYRLLTPWQLTDANGNRTQVAFDVLGFVSKTAVMGKIGDSDGDTLADPTTTFEYDLHTWQTTGKPNWAKTRTRETHADPSTAWLEQRTYFSGAGQTLMVKAQARPGLAPSRDASGALILDAEQQPVLVDTSPALRWVGNGRAIRDNKGNVLEAYEPYFSSTPEFEDEAELVEQGVTAVNHYDPLGRLTRTDLPNGTFSRVEFTPWQQTAHTVNDTVLDSSWYASRFDYAGSDVALLKEKRAALEAAKHANTPSVTHLDSLGRPFLAIAHNKDLQGNDEFFQTKSVLDIQGHVLDVIDARGNSAERRTYGPLGQSLKVESVDAGDRWHLRNALGQPMRSWDSRGHRFRVTHDTLHRPVDRFVSHAGAPEQLLGRTVYGDSLATPEVTNHRGRVYRVYDGAGVATTEAFDFKGLALSETRQLALDPKTTPDWSPLTPHATVDAMATAAAPLLDAETFSASSQRDALGRTIEAISPDGSRTRYAYDEGGGLRQVTLEPRGATPAQTVVGDMSYDAKGQRLQVVYGPAASPTSTTDYTYDPQTYRLTRLKTTRGSDSERLQSLHYHYDPAGNITDIRDTAQQTVFFQNTVVEAANSYTYDAVGRLIEATGREHASQGTAQRTHAQLPVGPQPMTSDPSAMRRYTQRYTYDAAGNILKLQHIPSSGTGWTRHYAYATDGNRLLSTSAPGDLPNPGGGPYSHSYTYDAHGSMVTMPHLPAMTWNPLDQLQHATAGTQEVYFQYAGGSNRSRKFTEHAGGTTEERIYLGPFELYRKRINGQLDLERETLHVSDGTGRICMVETKTADAGTPVPSPTPMWRFQLSNHLGSTATEVTETGAVISHEEYHPYGTSAYRSVDSSIDVSARRYRHTGMERDEETGLGYHTARYYAPWLGRWTAADPSGLSGGIDRYCYAAGNPARNTDQNGKHPPDESETLDSQWAASSAPTEGPGFTETYLGQSIHVSTEAYTGSVWVAADENPQEVIAQKVASEEARLSSAAEPERTPAPAHTATPATSTPAQPAQLYALPPVVPKYQRSEGNFGRQFEAAAQEMTLASNPLGGRMLMGGFWLALAPMALAEDFGEALYNVPYHADLMGQYAARMYLEPDAERALGDFGASFQHFTAGFGGALEWATVGVGTFSSIPRRTMSPSAPPAAEGGRPVTSEGTANRTQFEQLKADLAQQELAGAEPVGSALKQAGPFSPRTFGSNIDISHASPTFARDMVSQGQHFTIRGGDGVTRNLTQVIGEVDGVEGVFEFIVGPKGLTHQRFIPGGKITGFPNQRP